MADGTKMDARTARTKEGIRRAFREMILEMDCQKITVSELASRAQIHRKTFYLHYETIEDLFDELCEDIAGQVNAAVDAVLAEKDRADFKDIMVAFGQLLQNDDELHRRLFTTPSYNSVYLRIQDIATEHLYQSLLAQGNADPDVLKCVVLFAANGNNAVWRNYYATGYPDAPKVVPQIMEALTEAAWSIVPGQAAECE